MKKSNRGYSLVEIMVGLGIMSVIITSLMALFMDLFRSKATVESGQDITSLMYEVSGFLNNQPVCTGGLLGTPSTNGQAVVISPNIRSGGRYGTLTLTSVQINGVTNISGDTYRANISINGSGNPQAYGYSNFTRNLGFYYTVDGSNNLLSCLAQNVTNVSSCAALGGSWTGSTCNFCSSLGGTWNGSFCDFGGTTTTTTSTTTTSTTVPPTTTTTIAPPTTTTTIPGTCRITMFISVGPCSNPAFIKTGPGGGAAGMGWGGCGGISFNGTYPSGPFAGSGASGTMVHVYNWGTLDIGYSCPSASVGVSSVVCPGGTTPYIDKYYEEGTLMPSPPFSGAASINVMGGRNSTSMEIVCPP